MVNYKKLYLYLIRGIDDALTLFDHGDPFRAKALLQQLLNDVEDNVVSNTALPKRELLKFPDEK